MMQLLYSQRGDHPNVGLSPKCGMRQVGTYFILNLIESLSHIWVFPPLVELLIRKYLKLKSPYALLRVSYFPFCAASKETCLLIGLQPLFLVRS